MPTSAFLTGASGFIGANLARRLVRDGVETHALVREPARAWRLRGLSDLFHTHPGRLQDAERLSALVRELRPDVVYHLAAEGGYQQLRNSRAALETNLLGTINLMDACAESGGAVIVNAGSSSEYGATDVPMRESAALHPASTYAIAKAAVTHYGQMMARERGVPVITLRIFSAYGAWEGPGRFISTLMLKLLEEKLPPLVAADVGRDFIHVDDVVDGFVAAGRRPDLAGEVFNVGTGHQGTIREVVDLALAVSGLTQTPQYQTMAARSWDTSRWVADPARAAEALGFRARLDLHAGLRATWEWFRAHRHEYDAIAASSSS